MSSWGGSALIGMNGLGSDEVPVGDFMVEDAQIGEEQRCEGSGNQAHWSIDGVEEELSSRRREVDIR